MGKNRDFGQRVRQAREHLGCDRGTLARWVGVAVERLKLIEIGKLDESDLTQAQTAGLADTLQRSVDWLIRGMQSAEPLPGYTVVVAQRSRRGFIQQPLNYGPGLCPQCLQRSEGSRCNRCGHPVE